MNRTHSTPVEMNLASVSSEYRRYEDMRKTQSHADLASHSLVGGFSRTSSLADLAYVAVPGLTSRVVHNNSVVSLANLSDNFSEMPEHESPVVLRGGLSRPLGGSALVALLSTLMYGYNNANMNTPAKPMRAALGIPTSALTPDGVSVPLPSNDLIWSFIISIFMLGALLGCNSSSQLADRWGRKTYLLWNSVIFFVGALLEAASALPECAMVGGWDVCPKRVAVLLAGRLVSGIACGGATVVVPLYLGEVSPAHLRGMLGTMNQLMMVIGMFGAQLLGLPSSLGTMGGWPWMLAAPAVPALMQLLLQPMLLESPRWYAIMGNDLMAEEMLVQLRDCPPDDLEVQEELFCMFEAAKRANEMRPNSTSHSASCSRSNSMSSFASSRSNLPGLDDVLMGTIKPAPSLWSAIATSPAVRRAMLVTLTVMVLQQASGINNAFNFSTSFLLQNGMSDDTATAIAIAMNGCNVLVTIASVILMDQAGRRALLIFSICGMAISGTLLTVTLDHAGEAWVPATCVAAIVGFVGAFGIGLGPVACLLPSELFPATQRAAGSGLAFSVLWITQFITTFVFLLQANALGPHAFVPHVVVLVLGFIFTLIHVPETRGKSLEQIEREMEAE